MYDDLGDKQCTKKVPEGGNCGIRILVQEVSATTNFHKHFHARTWLEASADLYMWAQHVKPTYDNRLRALKLMAEKHRYVTISRYMSFVDPMRVEEFSTLEVVDALDTRTLQAVQQARLTVAAVVAFFDGSVIPSTGDTPPYREQATTEDSSPLQDLTGNTSAYHGQLLSCDAFKESSEIKTVMEDSFNNMKTIPSELSVINDKQNCSVLLSKHSKSITSEKKIKLADTNYSLFNEERSFSNVVEQPSKKTNIEKDVQKTCIGAYSSNKNSNIGSIGKSSSYSSNTVENFGMNCKGKPSTDVRNSSSEVNRTCARSKSSDPLVLVSKLSLPPDSCCSVPFESRTSVPGCTQAKPQQHTICSQSYSSDARTFKHIPSPLELTTSHLAHVKHGKTAIKCSNVTKNIAIKGPLTKKSSNVTTKVKQELLPDVKNEKVEASVIYCVQTIGSSSISRYLHFMSTIVHVF